MHSFEKPCYKCTVTKPISEFVRRSGGNSNYRNICKACEAIRVRKFSTTPEARRRSTENMRRWRAIPGNKERAKSNRVAINQKSPRTTFRLMIFNARKRAEVALTIEDLMALWIHQQKRCAVTGIVMTWSRGRIENTSMSLDRLNPDQNYIVGNVRLVCHAVNCFRGRMTDAEMFAMARAIVAKADAEDFDPTAFFEPLWPSTPARLAS